MNIYFLMIFDDSVGLVTRCYFLAWAGVFCLIVPDGLSRCYDFIPWSSGVDCFEVVV